MRTGSLRSNRILGYLDRSHRLVLAFQADEGGYILRRMVVVTIPAHDRIRRGYTLCSTANEFRLLRGTARGLHAKTVVRGV